MHDTAHFRGRNKDAVFEAFDTKEAVAGAISADRPLDGTARLGPYRIGLRPAAALRRARPSGAASCGRSAARPSSRATARAATLTTLRPLRASRTRPAGLATPPGTCLFLRSPRLPIRPPEFRSTRVQLTAPDPVRKLRGLPHLPGWRNW